MKFEFLPGYNKQFPWYILKSHVSDNHVKILDVIEKNTQGAKYNTRLTKIKRDQAEWYYTLNDTCAKAFVHTITPCYTTWIHIDNLHTLQKCVKQLNWNEQDYFVIHHNITNEQYTTPKNDLIYYFDALLTATQEMRAEFLLRYSDIRWHSREK